MYKVYYHLLLIAIFTMQLIPAQATEQIISPLSRERQLGILVDGVQKSASFTSWHDTRRLITKRAIGDQVLQRYELDIPEAIVGVMVDYILSTIPDHPELLEEVIDEQSTDKPDYMHGLCLLGSFIQDYSTYRHFQDCLILLESEEEECAASYVFKSCSFINSYFAPFDIGNNGEKFPLQFYDTCLKRCRLSHLSLDVLYFAKGSTLESCLIEKVSIDKTLTLEESTVSQSTFRKVYNLELLAEPDKEATSDQQHLLITRTIIHEGSVFEDCTLNVFFVNSTLDKVGIRACRLPCVHTRYCRFLHVDFQNLSVDKFISGVIGHVSEKQQTSFRQCKFQHSHSIRSAKFANTHFIDCTLDKYLTSTTLRGSSLDEKTLRKSYSEPVSLLTIILAHYVASCKK